MKVIFFNQKSTKDRNKLSRLRKSKKVSFIGPEIFINELSKIRNPSVKDLNQLDQIVKNISKNIKNIDAVYIPWRNVVLLIPGKDIFLELVTSRNRDLISKTEQKKLEDATVSFFGMSVGSNAALTWMLESRASTIKIVDPDSIDPTNLNRIRFGIDSLGRKKTEVTEENLYEINPYTRVYSYEKSQNTNLEKIITNHPKSKLIVDEIDDISAKYELRKIAKKLRLPLISAADLGDNVVLDVERYDQKPQPKPFLGRLGEVEKINFRTISKEEKIKLIIKLVGFKYDSSKIPESILQIGISIRTWPQLGATATIAGGVIATTAKKIILGENVVSGRYVISLDKLLTNDFSSKKNVARRNIYSKRVKKYFN